MTRKDTYTQCLESMYGLRRFGIKLGLSTITRLLDGLGNPQNRFRTIHIAGTNGKGSIASALSTILCQAGFRTGLYTSPHLVRFNERICVNNRPVSDESVIRSYEAVAALPPGERELTFFEFTTAMALYEFAAQEVEWAVIETGMGGRLDATNVIQPDLSVIASLSLEHQEYLGTTLGEIAGEKGGIIKPGKPVVAGVRQPEALNVLEKIAAEKSAPLFCIDRDFRVRPAEDDSFDYTGIYRTWENMRTGLSGGHQSDNAAVVLAACEVLVHNGLAIPEEAVREGLSRNRWPGRLEVVSTDPLLILDGAHNLDAVQKLAAFLETRLADRPLTLVLGILDDKPYTEMFRCLLPLCKRLILTAPRIYRAMPLEKLEQAARTIMQDVTLISDVGEAVNHAMITASGEEAICVAGSLYVVGEAKEFLETGGFPAFSLHSA